jgi:outer membrane immunogenic protein
VTYNGGFDLIHKTQVGWQVGAGLEYAMSEQLRLRGEYLYTDYGQDNGPHLHTNTNSFRLGLSYKF